MVTGPPMKKFAEAHGQCSVPLVSRSYSTRENSLWTTTITLSSNMVVAASSARVRKTFQRLPAASFGDRPLCPS